VVVVVIAEDVTFEPDATPDQRLIRQIRVHAEERDTPG
jgi:hypothetical protein